MAIQLMMATNISEPVGLDRGPAMLIASWILVGISTVFVLARGAARRRLTKIESGDILLPVALVAVDNGLGEPLPSLSIEDIGTYLEVMYWTRLLYITVLGITKTSIILLTLTLQPTKPIVVSCYIASSIVFASTLAFLLASAFQCSPPNPWQVNSHHCINLLAFQYALAATNILTDLIVVVLPMTAVCLLSVNCETKWFINTLCSTRLLVPAFAVVQICLLRNYTGSSDPTYDIVPYQIWTQVVLNVSIITACIPSLGGLLTDIASGITGRTIMLGDIELGRWSDRRSLCHRASKAYKRTGHHSLKHEDLYHTKEAMFCNPTGRASPWKTLSTTLNRFSWFRPTTKYTISNMSRSSIPPPRPVRPLSVDMLTVPMPPAFTHKSRGSITFDILAEYAESQPSQFKMHFLPDAAIPPRTTSAVQAPEASARPSSESRRWSLLIINTANKSQPDLQHTRDSSFASTATTVTPATHGRTGSNVSHTTKHTISHGRNSSNPTHTSSTQPSTSITATAPTRHPARPPTSYRHPIAIGSTSSSPSSSATTPHFIPDPRSQQYTYYNTNTNNIMNEIGHTLFKLPTHASYQNHRSKVSNVSQFSQDARVEEVNSDIGSNSGGSDENVHGGGGGKKNSDGNSGDGSFVDVDLEFERCRRL